MKQFTTTRKMMGDCTAICRENGTVLLKLWPHRRACNYHCNRAGTGTYVKGVMRKICCDNIAIDIKTNSVYCCS